MLLAACCERYVRALFTRLAAIGYEHLTPSQAITVMQIDAGFDTVTALAETSGMTVPAISKICTQLETDGLVRRIVHDADARSRRLALTDDGRQVLRQMRDAGRRAEDEWIALVGAETLDVVRAALSAYADRPAEPAAATLRIRFS
jgi:DNA-binding MarR family transcriptional regulator